jgi:hypothetical protein
MTLQTIRITARSGAVFGHRIASLRSEHVAVTGANETNLDYLAAAVEVISTTPRAERIIARVSPLGLDEHIDAYLTMLSTLTPSQAARLIVELYDPEASADLTVAYRLAKYVQRRMHICVAAWANPANPRQLVTTLKAASPNILLIHPNAAETDIAKGSRIEVLDILEAAQCSGCHPVVTGVHTLEQRSWYHEIGIRLFSTNIQVPCLQTSAVSADPASVLHAAPVTLEIA